jgi:hypothetical protein
MFFMEQMKNIFFSRNFIHVRFKKTVSMNSNKFCKLKKKYTKLKHNENTHSNNTLDFDVLKLCMCPSSHEMSQCEALRVLGQGIYTPRVQPGRNPSPCSSKSDCVADISDA